MGKKTLATTTQIALLVSVLGFMEIRPALGDTTGTTANATNSVPAIEKEPVSVWSDPKSTSEVAAEPANNSASISTHSQNSEGTEKKRPLEPAAAGLFGAMPFMSGLYFGKSPARGAVFTLMDVGSTLAMSMAINSPRADRDMLPFYVGAMVVTNVIDFFVSKHDAEKNLSSKITSQGAHQIQGWALLPSWNSKSGATGITLNLNTRLF